MKFVLGPRALGFRARFPGVSGLSVALLAVTRIEYGRLSGSTRRICLIGLYEFLYMQVGERCSQGFTTPCVYGSWKVSIYVQYLVTALGLEVIG